MVTTRSSVTRGQRASNSPEVTPFITKNSARAKSTKNPRRNQRTPTAVGKQKKGNSNNLPIPGLPGLARVQPSKGPARILVFTGSSEPGKDVVKLVDVTNVSYTSNELIAIHIQDHLNRQGQSPARAIATGNGDIDLFKFGYLLYSIHPHFIARFSLKLGGWVLEGVSDGKNPGKYLSVEDKGDFVILLKMALGNTLRVDSVTPVYSHERQLRATLMQDKLLVEVFEPRSSIAGPASAVRHMFFNTLTNQLLVMTRVGIFVYVEAGSRIGFKFDVPTAALDNGGTPYANRVFKIGKNNVLIDVPL